MSGIIDGFGGFGGVIGQVLIGYISASFGWSNTFYMFTIVLFLSGVPSFFFF